MLLYYGLFRIGEITDSTHVIKACDVHAAETEGKVMIVLHSSKTHSKANQPQKVRIVTDNRMKNFCPVAEIIKFAKMRKPWDTRQDPFLVSRTGKPIVAEYIRKQLKTGIKNLNLDPNLYDTHSFRIGRATDLRKQGLSVEDIKTQGRWKSNAVYKYLRE